MNKKALENIIKEIQDNANRKIEEYQRIADEKRKEILEKAEQELKKELEKLAAEKEREIRNMVNYIISQAKISEKRMLLEEQERGIQTVFDTAKGEAVKIQGYRRYLEKSLKKAKDLLGSGTISSRKSDEATVRAMLPPDFELEPSLEEREPGIIASSSDGKKILDMRISRRLEELRDELRKDVSTILYGGER